MKGVVTELRLLLATMLLRVMQRLVPKSRTDTQAALIVSAVTLLGRDARDKWMRERLGAMKREIDQAAVDQAVREMSNRTYLQ